MFYYDIKVEIFQSLSSIKYLKKGKIVGCFGLYFIKCTKNYHPAKPLFFNTTKVLFCFIYIYIIKNVL